MSIYFFCSHDFSRYPTEAYPVWVFSNWYLSKYVHNRYTYSCVEQEMMHQKALIFGDVTTADKILAASHPGEMKKLGRQVKNYNDKVWAEKRYQIVYEAVYAKFTQDEKVASILLGTKNGRIVEAASYDRIWGIGYSVNNALSNKARWGQNLLGKALMQVRGELQK